MADEEVSTSVEQAEEASEDSVGYAAQADNTADASDSDEYDPSSSLQDHFGDAAPADDNEAKDQYDPTVSQPLTSSLTRDPSLPPSDPAHHPNPNLRPSQTPSRSESRASQSASASTSHVQTKAKTIGGCVVEDEDEDEDDKGEAEYEPPGVEDVGLGSAGMIERPISENANKSVSTSGVSVHTLLPVMASFQDFSNNSPSRPSSAVPPNGGSFTGQNLYNVYTSQAGYLNDSSAPTPTSATHIGPAATKGRLPHDLVGLLEDRIRDDPRGDISAWLELINEHRSRNRIDSAREVFERFLKVFPAAVSFACLFQQFFPKVPTF
jgi:cleavage stimulation factor subunit 3